MAFLASRSTHVCLMSANPTLRRSSSCLTALESPSSQEAALFKRRNSNLAASGPIPPHVPKAIGRKDQPAFLQWPKYFCFFSFSLFTKKERHFSLVASVAVECRMEACQPCYTVRSTAVSFPAIQFLSNRSAGLSCVSGQFGITTSLSKGCPASESTPAKASCVAW